MPSFRTVAFFDCSSVKLSRQNPDLYCTVLYCSGFESLIDPIMVRLFGAALVRQAPIGPDLAMFRVCSPISWCRRWFRLNGKMPTLTADCARLCDLAHSQEHQTRILIHQKW